MHLILYMSELVNAGDIQLSMAQICGLVLGGSSFLGMIYQYFTGKIEKKNHDARRDDHWKMLVQYKDDNAKSMAQLREDIARHREIDQKAASEVRHILRNDIGAVSLRVNTLEARESRSEEDHKYIGQIREDMAAVKEAIKTLLER